MKEIMLANILLNHFLLPLSIILVQCKANNDYKITPKNQSNKGSFIVGTSLFVTPTAKSNPQKTFLDSASIVPIPSLHHVDIITKRKNLRSSNHFLISGERSKSRTSPSYKVTYSRKVKSKQNSPFMNKQRKTDDFPRVLKSYFSSTNKDNNMTRKNSILTTSSITSNGNTPSPIVNDSLSSSLGDASSLPPVGLIISLAPSDVLKPTSFEKLSIISSTITPTIKDFNDQKKTSISSLDNISPFTPTNEPSNILDDGSKVVMSYNMSTAIPTYDHNYGTKNVPSSLPSDNEGANEPSYILQIISEAMMSYSMSTAIPIYDHTYGTKNFPSSSPSDNQGTNEPSNILDDGSKVVMSYNMSTVIPTYDHNYGTKNVPSSLPSDNEGANEPSYILQNISKVMMSYDMSTAIPIYDHNYGTKNFPSSSPSDNQGTNEPSNNSDNISKVVMSYNMSTVIPTYDHNYGTKNFPSSLPSDSEGVNEPSYILQNISKVMMSYDMSTAIPIYDHTYGTKNFSSSLPSYNQGTNEPSNNLDDISKAVMSYNMSTVIPTYDHNYGTKNFPSSLPSDNEGTNEPSNILDDVSKVMMSYDMSTAIPTNYNNYGTKSLSSTPSSDNKDLSSYELSHIPTVKVSASPSRWSSMSSSNSLNNTVLICVLIKSNHVMDKKVITIFEDVLVEFLTQESSVYIHQVRVISQKIVRDGSIVDDLSSNGIQLIEYRKLHQDNYFVERLYLLEISVSILGRSNETLFSDAIITAFEKRKYLYAKLMTLSPFFGNTDFNNSSTEPDFIESQEGKNSFLTKVESKIGFASFAVLTLVAMFGFFCSRWYRLSSSCDPQINKIPEHIPELDYPTIDHLLRTDSMSLTQSCSATRLSQIHKNVQIDEDSYRDLYYSESDTSNFDVFEDSWTSTSTGKASMSNFPLDGQPFYTSKQSQDTLPTQQLKKIEHIPHKHEEELNGKQYSKPVILKYASFEKDVDNLSVSTKLQELNQGNKKPLPLLSSCVLNNSRNLCKDPFLGSNRKRLCNSNISESNCVFSDSSSYSYGSNKNNNNIMCGWETYEVTIPPGPLGILVQTSPMGPKVVHIKEKSPVLHLVDIGDLILKVDLVDTSRMTAQSLSGCMRDRGLKERMCLTLLGKQISRNDYEQDNSSSV